MSPARRLAWLGALAAGLLTAVPARAMVSKARTIASRPDGPHASASDLVRLMTAALDAPYGTRVGVPLSPATDATLMTDPVRRSSMCRPTACVRWTIESTLRRMTFSQPEKRSSVNGPM